MFPPLHSLEPHTYATVFIASDTGFIRRTSVLKPIQSAPQTPSPATPLSVKFAKLEPKAASPQKQETSDDKESDTETLRSFSSALDKWPGLGSKAAACQSQDTPQHAESNESILRNLRVKLENLREVITSASQTQDTSRNADLDTFRARIDELDNIVNCRLESEIAAALKQNIPEDGDSNAGILFGVVLGALLTCYIALKCAGNPIPFTL